MGSTPSTLSVRIEDGSIVSVPYSAVSEIRIKDTKVFIYKTGIKDPLCVAYNSREEARTRGNCMIDNLQQVHNELKSRERTNFNWNWN